MVEREAVHHSADAEYESTPAGSTYEHTDARIGVIVKFLFWVAVSTIVVHVGLGLFYEVLIQQATAREAQQIRYPLAVGQEPRLPPVPRLQTDPAGDITGFRAEEERLLQSYGWQNREAGTVRIPIEEAMRLSVERGLVSGVEAGGGSRTPGMMPTDASAGRVMERRRQ